MDQRTYDFDFIVIGSGFGGSVSALRLTEKGYKVAVLERGKRWQKENFPKTNWNDQIAITSGIYPYKTTHIDRNISCPRQH
jgi:choline dehydrogenase-like flavoprotein